MAVVTVGMLAAALAVSAPALADVPAPASDEQVTPPSAPGDQQEPLQVAPPSRANGATTARIVAPTLARRRLGSAKPARRVQASTAWSHQPQVLLVLDATTRGGRDWVKVLLGDRPNGSTGWVPLDYVHLSHTDYWIEVRRGARRVTVYRAGKRVRSFRAVIGKRKTPTPLGLSAIYERNRQPNPRAFLGPWVLSLTSHSNVLDNYDGGPGRVAIHGRAGASFRDPLGSARSHGCIRVNNGDIAWMAKRITAGTPVQVRR